MPEDTESITINIQWRRRMIGREHSIIRSIQRVAGHGSPAVHTGSTEQATECAMPGPK